MSAGGPGPLRARQGPGRWHFQHGPIDLILDVDGESDACECSVEACWVRFQTVLRELVSELPELRRPAGDRPGLRGPVARRMLRACEPWAATRFITPMAAVAGAVADELIGTFARPGIRRAFINNGGDIALHLAPRETYRVGIWSDLDRVPSPAGFDRSLDGIFTVSDETPARGVATSGWRGRSFSLGIADSVTVLADCAASADAAATMIANAVNCDYGGIARTPANQLKDDTDLGTRLVTVEVPPLPASVIAEALAGGRAEAEWWRKSGVIYAAALFLQGTAELVSPDALLLPNLRPQPATSRTFT